MSLILNDIPSYLFTTKNTRPSIEGVLDLGSKIKYRKQRFSGGSKYFSPQNRARENDSISISVMKYQLLKILIDDGKWPRIESVWCKRFVLADDATSL